MYAVHPATTDLSGAGDILKWIRNVARGAQGKPPSGGTTKTRSGSAAPSPGSASGGGSPTRGVNDNPEVAFRYIRQAAGRYVQLHRDVQNAVKYIRNHAIQARNRGIEDQFGAQWGRMLDDFSMLNAQITENRRKLSAIIPQLGAAGLDTAGLAGFPVLPALVAGSLMSIAWMMHRHFTIMPEKFRAQRALAEQQAMALVQQGKATPEEAREMLKGAAEATATAGAGSQESGFTSGFLQPLLLAAVAIAIIPPLLKRNGAA